MKKLITLISLILIFLLVGCKNENIENEKNNNIKEDTSFSKIFERGTLVVGTSADFAPREFHMVVDGKDEIVGYDISFAKEIANDMGVELKIIDISFDGLLMALEAEQVDMVIAGMTPTPERLEIVDFSKTYGKSDEDTDGQKILIKKSDKDLYNSVDSFNGKKVGAQKGGIQEAIVNEQLKGAKLISFPKVPNMIVELDRGMIDAVVLPSYVCESYANNYKNLFVTDIKIAQNGSGTGVALKKGSNALTEQVNKTIDRVMSDGTMDRLIEEAEKLVDELNVEKQ